MLSLHYDIGSFVQLARGGRVYQVLWRGQVVGRDRYGFISGQWVYYLNDGHWDCYYEDELYAIFRTWY